MRALFLPVVIALTTAPLLYGGDEIPRLVLVDGSEYEGRHEGLYEDAYYLWLHVDELASERAEWRLGLDNEQDVMLSSLEILAEFGLDSEDRSFLAALIQPGAAREHRLRSGQRIPPERFSNICNAASFDPSQDAWLDKPPRHFVRHAEEARGAVLGRVIRIAHGFSGSSPSLLLELDVEETLIVSDYSLHPYLVVATSGYVHDGTVYCSPPVLGGWLPAVGDRLVAMPVTGPWDGDGQVMPIVDPIEVFLVGEPDKVGVSEVRPLSKRSSVPKTLLDFRRRLWDIRDEFDHQGDGNQVPLQ